MWYAIISEDVENSMPLRKVHRADHLARLHALNDQGRLLVAGPNPIDDTEEIGPSGVSGSLIIAEFDSLQQAQVWASADPYVVNGVHSSSRVKPFKKVLP